MEFRVALFLVLIVWLGKEGVKAEYQSKDGTNINPISLEKLDVIITPALTYFIKITVGGQNLNVSLNFSTSTTSFALPECNCIQGANSYNPTLSPYSQNLSSKTSNSIKKDSNTYFEYRDQISIGEMNPFNLTFLAASHHFNLANQASGILGLSRSNRNDHYNMIWNLKHNKIIESAVFSILLINPSFPNQYPIFTVGDYSHYWYGDDDSIKVIKSLDTIGNLWACNVRSFAIGKIVYEVIDRRFIGYFGTDWYIGIPFDLYNEFKYSVIQSKYGSGCIEKKGMLNCPCSSDNTNFKEFPQIGFEINGTTFTLDPDDYIVTYNSNCILLVTGMKHYYFGSPFFAQYYSVFNLESGVISISKGYEYLSKKPQEKPSSIIYSALSIFTLFLLLISIKFRNPKQDPNSYLII